MIVVFRGKCIDPSINREYLTTVSEGKFSQFPRISLRVQSYQS